MDALGVGGVSVRCFSVSGGGGGESSNKISAPASSPVCVGVGSRKGPRFRRSRVVLGVSRCDYFREKDHLDYYYNYSSSEGRGRLRAEKMVVGGKGTRNLVDKGKGTKEKKILKKMLKLQTQIQADVPISFEIGGLFPDRVNPYNDRVKVAKMISVSPLILLIILFSDS